MQCLFLQIPDYCQPERIRANRISLGLPVRDLTPPPPTLPTDDFAAREKLLNDFVNASEWSNGELARFYKVTPPTIRNWRSETRRDVNRQAQRPWRKANPDKVREQKRREGATTHGRVKRNQRERFRKFLKKKRTTGRLADWIGCEWKTLVVWLEDMFEPGMTWDNYGTMWHIDHVKPLKSFDLRDDKQVAEAWHVSNLQPLWAEDNIAKGSKLDF